MSGVREFCEYIQHQKPYILVSFRQNINFKQRTELTNGCRAENKSQEKQGFHLDAGQFVGTLACSSAVKLSCRENDGADGNRTLVLALLTAVSCKEMPFKANQIAPIVRKNYATCVIIKPQKLPHTNQNILELHCFRDCHF